MAAYVSLCYHIVFSTKGRQRLIIPDVRPRLWGYIGGIVQNANGIPLAVGGVEDHVHILAVLDKNRTVPDCVREMKTNSSRWMHDTFPHLSFVWQEGYGAFTVGVKSVAQVKAYIANQDEHHRKTTFEDEFRSFLEQHGVEYEESYVWG